MLSVIKRDGNKVPFSKEPIQRAIVAAAEAKAHDGIVNHARDVSLAVEKQLEGKSEVAIILIQKLVENGLMHGPYPELARSYIQYRHDRDQARESQSDLTKEILGLMGQTDEDVLKENANKDGRVIPTQRDLLAGIVSKHFARKYILSKEISEAHETGILHFHDADYSPFFPSFNCMLADVGGMLNNGFKMGNAEIERPTTIATAAAITAQVIAQVASHTYGGTTINRIDEILAPFAESSFAKHLQVAHRWGIANAESYARECTEKEIYKAIKSLEYEVNTLHTANGQTPFVTFGFGLGETWYAKSIQKAILNVRMEGLGKNAKTAVFPKLTFTLKRGHNLEKSDPFYDVKRLALKCASERMYPKSILGL